MNQSIAAGVEEQSQVTRNLTENMQVIRELAESNLSRSAGLPDTGGTFDDLSRLLTDMTARFSTGKAGDESN